MHNDDERDFEEEAYNRTLMHSEPDYCDYCEREGHSFRTCPARDDSFDENAEVVEAGYGQRTQTPQCIRTSRIDGTPCPNHAEAGSDICIVHRHMDSYPTGTWTGD